MINHIIADEIEKQLLYQITGIQTQRTLIVTATIIVKKLHLWVSINFEPDIIKVSRFHHYRSTNFDYNDPDMFDAIICETKNLLNETLPQSRTRPTQ